MREVCASDAEKRGAAVRINSSALEHGCCPQPPYSPGVHFLFLLVSKNETAATRTSFPERSLNSGAIANRLTGNSQNSVLFVLAAVAETLYPLHKLERELL